MLIRLLSGVIMVVCSRSTLCTVPPLPPAETVWPDNQMVKERTRFGAHSIMDTDEEVVFLTSRETYAMDVDWVRIWRA